MANDAQTILVKKSDGTFVRMRLDEVRQKQSGGKMNAAPTVSPKMTPPVVQTKTVSSVAASTPSPRPSRATPPMSPPPKTAREDFAAPLAEELAQPANPGSRVSTGRVDQIDAVMKSLSFTVPAHSTNRLRTIIQLCLKEVRTIDQTRSSLIRTELDGGMGLTSPQAEEVLKKCQMKPAGAASGAVRPLKPRLGDRLVSVDTWPSVRPMPPYPAISSPNNAFVRQASRPAPIISAPRSGVPARPLPARPAVLSRVELEKPFKISSESNNHKAIMHDVVTRPLEMTPVDEIRYFSLTDFRRLSGDPAEAARRLKQKFSNLKDESVVIYLQALTAWRISSLYLEYLNFVLGDLASGQKITMPRDKKLMQWSELQAVVAMEQSLDYL